MSFFDKLFGRKPQEAAETDPAPELYQQLAPVFDEIGSEALSCTPENWTHAVFTIQCDGRRIDYSLKNHLEEEGTANISPRLAQLAEELYSLMASHGDRWTTAKLQYDQDGDSWKFQSNFAYD